MSRFTIPFLIIMMLSGCTTTYPPMPTVRGVDLNRYLGTWYEIARYEHFFEKGCRDVTATYTLKDDGDIKVVNRCVKKKNVIKEAVGVAYTTNSDNSKLKVSFFRPFYGDYWIIMLDHDYRYAVIGDPSREYLWILARTPKLEESVIHNILKRLPDMGYSVEQLTWTIQGDHDV